MNSRSIYLACFVLSTLIGLISSISDEAEVARIQMEIRKLIRLKYNITESQPETLLSNDGESALSCTVKLTVAQAQRKMQQLKVEMGIVDENSTMLKEPKTGTWKFPIAYVFNGEHSEKEKNEIRKGFNWWQSNTCAKFSEFTSQSAVGRQPYILIIKGSGCWSYVGRISTGMQKLSLGEGCVYAGTAAHEMGHALGFNHEHQRHDRDYHVSIGWQNVIKNAEDAFQLDRPDETIDFGTGYDGTSIMHYSSLAFSKDYWGKKRTIVPKDPYQLTSFGSNMALSFADVKRINTLYSCIESNCIGVKLAKPCQNGGYQDPLQCKRCRCPFGLGGDFCEAAISPSTSQCGGSINVPQCSSISIASPVYPNKYPSNTICSWNVTSSGGLIVAFDKEPDMPADDDDSCLDFVEIKTNISALYQSGNRFCTAGKSNGRVAVTDKGKVFVIFSSEPTGQGKGFKMTVYSTCKGTTAAGLTKECRITQSGYDYEGKNSGSRVPMCPTSNSTTTTTTTTATTTKVTTPTTTTKTTPKSTTTTRTTTKTSTKPTTPTTTTRTTTKSKTTPRTTTTTSTRRTTTAAKETPSTTTRITTTRTLTQTTQFNKAQVSNKLYIVTVVISTAVSLMTIYGL